MLYLLNVFEQLIFGIRIVDFYFKRFGETKEILSRMSYPTTGYNQRIRGLSDLCAKFIRQIGMN